MVFVIASIGTLFAHNLMFTFDHRIQQWTKSEIQPKIQQSTFTKASVQCMRVLEWSIDAPILSGQANS